MADPLFTLQAMPAIAARLALRGFDPATMLRTAGLPESQLEAEVTAPLSRLTAFMDAAAAKLEDPILGITLADTLDPSAFGFTAFASRAAPTVRLGLRTLSDLAALINPIGLFTLHERSPTATLEYVVAGSDRGLGCHLNEHTLWLVARYAKDALAGGFPLERAWVLHHRDALGIAALEARLECSVEFGAPSVGFSFASALLDARPRGADEQLFEFLTAQARGLLDARTSDVIAAVMRAIELRIADPQLGISKIAKVLALSPRSVQR
nr:AraC family transcriptional regulator ligand-binding domain-containing protein [Deltaproteobacteria bacterium]